MVFILLYEHVYPVIGKVGSKVLSFGFLSKNNRSQGVRHFARYANRCCLAFLYFCNRITFVIRIIQRQDRIGSIFRCQPEPSFRSGNLQSLFIIPLVILQGRSRIVHHLQLEFLLQRFTQLLWGRLCRHLHIVRQGDKKPCSVSQCGILLFLATHHGKCQNP